MAELVGQSRGAEVGGQAFEDADGIDRASAVEQLAGATQPRLLLESTCQPDGALMVPVKRGRSASAERGPVEAFKGDVVGGRQPKAEGTEEGDDLSQERACAFDRVHGRRSATFAGYPSISEVHCPTCRDAHESSASMAAGEL